MSHPVHRRLLTAAAGAALVAVSACSSEAGPTGGEQASASPGSIPSTVIEARGGGTVTAGGCLLVRPPASWVLRAADVNPSPGAPGYIDLAYPEQFRRDSSCESAAAVLVTPDIPAGSYTVTLAQDGRRLAVPVTVASGG